MVSYPHKEKTKNASLIRRKLQAVNSNQKERNREK